MDWMKFVCDHLDLHFISEVSALLYLPTITFLLRDTSIEYHLRAKQRLQYYVCIYQIEICC